MSYSSGQIGPKSMWQASDETGVKRPSASTSAATPSPVPGSENDLRPLAAELERPDPPHPGFRDRRQRQRLRLEVVEQQPLAKARAARRLRPVHHPGRVGELKGPPDDRPGAADDHRARARPELGRRRLDRLGQARIVVGPQMDDLAQARSGLVREREARRWCRQCRRREPERERRNRSWPTITQDEEAVVKVRAGQRDSELEFYSNSSNRRGTNVIRSRPQKIALLPKTRVSNARRPS